MNKKIITILFLSLLVITSVIADEHNTQDNQALNDFHISYDNNDAQLDQKFTSLKPSEQQDFLHSQIGGQNSLSKDPQLRSFTIQYISKPEFNPQKNPKDFAIAQNYFGSNTLTENAQRINHDTNTRKAFEQFAKANGVTIKINGPIEVYSGKTALLGNSVQRVKLDSFVNSPYFIKVTEQGKIQIEVAHDQSVHTFEGELSVDQKTPVLLNIDNGKVDGKEIRKGKFSINKRGVFGEAEQFGSAKFLGSTKFNYNGKVINLQNTKITSIGTDSISGEDVVIGETKLLSGKLDFTKGKVTQVGENTDVSLLGMMHETRESVDIKYADNQRIADISESEKDELSTLDQVSKYKKGDPRRVVEAEAIRRKYRDMRNEEYDSVISKIKPIGNYFIYGTERFWMGGTGFTSSMAKKPFFEEFPGEFSGSKTATRKGHLEFTANGMNLDVQKISDDDRPLALKMNIEGDGKIIDGKHRITIKDGKVRSKTLPSFRDGVITTGVDLRIKHEHAGVSQTYDLDIDTAYNPILTPTLKKELMNEMVLLGSEYEALQRDLEKLRPAISNYDQLQKDLEQAVTGKLNIIKARKHVIKEIKRYESEGNTRKAEELKQSLVTIRSSEDESEKEIQSLRSNIKDAEFDVSLATAIQKRDRFNRVEDQIKSIDKKIKDNRGERETGVFGQVLSARDGNARVSYQEYIEGLPIRKNVQALSYYGSEIGAGNRETNVELEVPLEFAQNRDVLDIDVIENQECIDTQFRLQWEYAIATGNDVCYDGGRKCLSKSSNKEAFLNRWMFSKGTFHYEKAVAKGYWRRDVEAIPPERYNEIQPGDILLPGGHAIGVKEVLEIPPGSGTKYVRTFAGSQPAIDARVYPGLIRIDELKDKAVKGVYRPKFRGVGKTEANIKDLYQFSEQKSSLDN